MSDLDHLTVTVRFFVSDKLPLLPARLYRLKERALLLNDSFDDIVEGQKVFVSKPNFHFDDGSWFCDIKIEPDNDPLG